jgi:hypothetical protein
VALLAGGILLFFGGAAALEWSRRRERSRRRLIREWESVHNIFHERGIPDEDAALIEQWVLRHASKAPLHAVTTREGFEALVAQGIERARRVEVKTLPRDAATLDNLGVRLRGIRTELGLDTVPAGSSMTSTRDLSDGQWLSIARGDADPPQWFRVMIEDVNEAFFYVSYKDGPPSTAPVLPVGAPVRCGLWRGEDARYTFETVAAAYTGPPPTWTLKHTSTLHRTQNRAHYRIRHDQAVVAGVLNAPRDPTRAGDVASRRAVTKLPGQLSSLSAGGCAIVFKQSLTRHVLLRITLELPREVPIEAVVEIVSTAHISGGRYLVRGKFLGLSEEAQDRISRYVHLKQQQRRDVPPDDRDPSR